MTKRKVKFFQTAEFYFPDICSIIKLKAWLYYIFFIRGDTMQQDLIFYIITTAIGIALSVIGYFLKRTMDRLDRNETVVSEMKEAQYALSDKYATKAEVAEIKAAMQKLSDNIDYIKEHTTKNEDFIRVMTRLESKIDNYYNQG